MAMCQQVHNLRQCPVVVGSPQTQPQRDQVTRVINRLLTSTRFHRRTLSESMDSSGISTESDSISSSPRSPSTFMHNMPIKPGLSLSMSDKIQLDSINSHTSISLLEKPPQLAEAFVSGVEPFAKNSVLIPETLIDQKKGAPSTPPKKQAREVISASSSSGSSFPFTPPLSPSVASGQHLTSNSESFHSIEAAEHSYSHLGKQD